MKTKMVYKIDELRYLQDLETSNNFYKYEIPKMRSRQTSGSKFRTQNYCKHTPFSQLTRRMSPVNRGSRLGDNVSTYHPKEFLNSLHKKTYFKGCTALRIGYQKQALGKSNLLKGKFLEIKSKLDQRKFN